MKARFSLKSCIGARRLWVAYSQQRHCLVRLLVHIWVVSALWLAIAKGGLISVCYVCELFSNVPAARGAFAARLPWSGPYLDRLCLDFASR